MAPPTAGQLPDDVQAEATDGVGRDRGHRRLPSRQPWQQSKTLHTSSRRATLTAQVEPDLGLRRLRGSPGGLGKPEGTLAKAGDGSSGARVSTGRRDWIGCPPRSAVADAYVDSRLHRPRPPTCACRVVGGELAGHDWTQSSTSGRARALTISPRPRPGEPGRATVARRGIRGADGHCISNGSGYDPWPAADDRALQRRLMPPAICLASELTPGIRPAGRRVPRASIPRNHLLGFRLLICETQVKTRRTRFAISMASYFRRSWQRCRPINLPHIGLFGHMSISVSLPQVTRLRPEIIRRVTRAAISEQLSQARAGQRYEASGCDPG